jgi:hypothetical protein
MQYFGEYDTKFNEEFLTRSYLYVNPKGEEELTVEQFRELIKNRKLLKANIIGTIVLYNPFVHPKGYDNKQSLTQQDYDFDQGLVELKVEREMTMLKANIKEGYEGKIIEVRHLFNLLTDDINKPERLVALDDDLSKLHTAQLTTYDREMNYLDLNNLTFNGKFIFFAWGNKINRREFDHIFDYAQLVYDKAVQTQKRIVFIYRKQTKPQASIEKLHFFFPFEVPKFKHPILRTLGKVFAQFPPESAEFEERS